MGVYESKTVNGYNNFEVPYNLISKDKETNRLAIILPGIGYTIHSPLLHFTAKLLLNKGYDVLQVNYQYNREEYKDIPDISEVIKIDVENVIDNILDNHAYESFCIIGKSLGTIAMSTELNKNRFEHAHVVWLTPLIHREDVLNAMIKSNHAGLCMIGDEDPCYSPNNYLKVKGNTHITSKLIQDVDHSLEYAEDSISSIDVVKDIISDLDAFLDDFTTIL